MIDVLTTFHFPDGKAILRHALSIRDNLMKLKARARALRIPVLYVNDNFGDWRSEKEVLIGRCLESAGAEFVRPLIPDSEDYFVLKPLHSAFYMTPLEVLLQHLLVETLILTGLTSTNCLTATALDANMRGFDLFVPHDCSCARTPEEHRRAVAQLQVNAGAKVTRSRALRLPDLIRRAQSAERGAADR